MTGLSQRKIRYYEQRHLISPQKCGSGTRKYSLADIEVLMDIYEKIQQGFGTDQIRKEMHEENESY